MDATGFACDCGKTHRSQSSLSRHRRTHKTAPYTCGICQKTYFRRDLLKMHKSKHEGDKHLCDDCGKSFTTAWYFRQHVAIKHQKKFNFTCDLCEKVCNQISFGGP